MSTFARLSRQEFVTWLANENTPPASYFYDPRELPKLSAHEVLLIWDEEKVPFSRVPIIVVENGDLQDFFAFTSTYVSTYSPFSAFFRVVTKEIYAKKIFDLSLNRQSYLPREILAVAIAEAVSQVNQASDDLSKITTSACRATLSYSIISALYLDYSAEDIPAVIDKWQFLRRSLGEDRLRLPVSVLHDFWMTVASSFAPGDAAQAPRGERRAVSEFLRSVLIDGRVDAVLWRKISEGIAGAENLLGSLTGSREKQVKSLDQFNQGVIAADDIDPGRRALLTGFVTSLVAQGSMRYLPMALSADRRLPSAAGLWFALFSAVRKETDALDIANGLGRHLARDLPGVELYSKDPKADISFEELVFVHGSRLNNPQFRTRSQSSLLVELLPGVNATFPVRSSKQDGSDRANFAPRLRELQNLLDNARQVIEDIQGNNGQQAELFDKSVPSRYIRGRRERK